MAIFEIFVRVILKYYVSLLSFSSQKWAHNMQFFNTRLKQKMNLLNFNLRFVYQVTIVSDSKYI